MTVTDKLFYHHFCDCLVFDPDICWIDLLELHGHYCWFTHYEEKELMGTENIKFYNFKWLVVWHNKQKGTSLFLFFSNIQRLNLSPCIAFFEESEHRRQSFQTVFHRDWGDFSFVLIVNKPSQGFQAGHCSGIKPSCLSFPVGLPMLACSNIGVCECACTHTRGCEGWRSVLGIISQKPVHFVSWERFSHWDLGLWLD